MTYFVRTDLKMRVRNYEGYVGDRTLNLAIPETQFSVSYFLILSYLYSGQATLQP